MKVTNKKCLQRFQTDKKEAEEGARDAQQRRRYQAGQAAAQLQ